MTLADQFHQRVESANAEASIREAYRKDLLISRSDIQPWALLGSDCRKAVAALEHIVPPYNAVKQFHPLSLRKHPEDRDHFIADIPRAGDLFGQFRCHSLPTDQGGPYEIRLLVGIPYPRDPVLRQQYLDGKTDDTEWMFHDETIDHYWVNIDTIPGHEKLQGQSIFEFWPTSFLWAHPYVAFRVEVCLHHPETRPRDLSLYQMEIAQIYLPTSLRPPYQKERNEWSLASRELLKKLIE